MAIDAHALFSAVNASKTATWKPAAAYATPAAKPTAGAEPAAVKASAGVGADTVKVSKLGQELSGLAADLFKQFDDKTRRSIESAVETGRLSAKEAVDGLNAYAKQALFSRHTQERTPTPEEQAKLAASAANWQGQQDHMVAVGAIRKEQADSKTAAQARYEAGEITWDEMGAAWQAAGKAAGEKMAGVGPRPQLQAGGELSLKTPALEEFMSLDLGDGDPASNNIHAAEFNQAKSRFFEALNLAPTALSSAMKSFASSYGEGLGKTVAEAVANRPPTAESTANALLAALKA